jgi:hypothetical protein
VIVQPNKHRRGGYTVHACCSWKKGLPKTPLVYQDNRLSSPSHN